MLLMIDNYDSFTYNLVQYFGELGETVRTVRNDAIDVDAIEALAPSRKTDTIDTTGEGVFRDLPRRFEIARYHSLVVERDTLPDCLEVTATSADGQVMGLRHRTLAVEGVQFHPESVASEHGHALLRNFLAA